MQITRIQMDVMQRR